MSVIGELARRGRTSGRLPDTWSGARVRLAVYAGATAGLTVTVVLLSPLGTTLGYCLLYTSPSPRDS